MAGPVGACAELTAHHLWNALLHRFLRRSDAMGAQEGRIYPVYISSSEERLMSTRLVVVLIATLLCGCSSVEMVKVHDDDDSLQKVNRAMRGQVVKLELQNGERMNITSAYMASDSLTWFDGRTNTLKAEPTSNVREVSVRRAGRGAVGGLIVGAVAGAAFGGIRAVAEGDDPGVGNDPVAATKEKKLRVYPVAHAVYASLITTPIGAIIGAQKRFRIESQEVSPAAVSKR